MGLVTFSLLNLFFAIEAKDERQSAFSLDTFSDRTFLLTTGLSFFLIVMSTVLAPFETILKTVTLDVRQWLICTVVALAIIVAAEIRKALKRRTAPTALVADR
jgi:Ca2+-transporting ATPase